MTAEGVLYTELAALRKGWGVRRPNIRDRIGPELRKLCNIDESATHSAARERLVALLEGTFSTLPSDVALAARVMLGMDPDYPDQTLTLRQRRLAEVRNVDPITVRRRCDVALQMACSQLAEHGAGLLAERLVDTESFQSTDWYTVVVSTVLRLDTPRPEATEVRRIVSLKNGLGGVVLGLGLPGPRSESRSRMGLDAEMRFGGELESVRQPSAEYFLHYIRFPRPLSSGEQHSFGRIIRIPAGQLMAPHYVSRPLHRVDRFELRVRFDPASLPKLVWRLYGIPYHVSEAGVPGRDILDLDGQGEVAAVFHRLKLNFGYGVRWLP